jgi:hypothetical protein
MSPLDRRPWFLGGGGTGVPPVELLERDDCDIWKFGDMVALHVVGRWTRRHAALARQYDVNAVSLSGLSFGNRETVDFLLDLPLLRRVSISLGSVKDLSALGKLTKLQWLVIQLTLWRIGDNFKPIDFSTLNHLRRAHLMMCPAFESVLKCSTLEVLDISNDCDGRLRDLDLTHLPSLRELTLDHCPKLRSVALHPKARVGALEQTYCGSYQIDWRRFGPDLRYLKLGGRLTFPLDDLLKAPRLKELHMLGIRKVPPLKRLSKLRDLTTLFVFAPPPGPKLSREDEAVIRDINARRQRKPTELRRKKSPRPDDLG